MAHAAGTVDVALELRRQGLAPQQIADALDVPRRTVVDWIAGRAPRRDADPRGRAQIAALPPAYIYLLGLYLGDGCISTHPRGVFKLRIALDTRYPGIAEECAAAMAAVMPANRVCSRRRVDNCFEVCMYSKRWPLLFPQHGPGKKHERTIGLEPWQREFVERYPQLLLRGLIHSDGCRFLNTGRNWSNPRYSFSNRSADIRAIFCDACDLYGVHWTTAPSTVYVSRKADVARLDEAVGQKA